ncbi:hypothetical protein LSH36_409g02056 [Paralvinella palmiformis]|uniref:Inorganic pyrophosphatase n=1 Tax=Paralvinella palmiformis TaxID=53620 RepID=A0AAD9JCV1_9ANNE|nr:hypothetical protein LSH36_409g02056 [Paralvinella palmiformis]
MSYSIIERGSPNTLEYRLFFSGPNGPLSPLHDIPLYADKANNTFNMVVEVPRWTNAKMEIDTKNRLNPIKQDVKKGKLRYVHNCFPHHGYIWNYGALPQTWEDPAHKDEHTQQNGDNDPIDVCEIGFKAQKRGSVIKVKALGIMALIDEGETDWKVLAIDVTDPLADKLNDVEDVEKLMPGFLKATNEWFRIYKIPAGKPENQFAFNGEAKNRAFAHQIIEQTHEQWQKLITNQCDAAGLSCENVSVAGSSFTISTGEAQEAVNAQQCNNELQQLISSSLRCLKGPPPPVAGVGPSLGHPSVIGLCHSRWRLPPAHYFSDGPELGADTIHPGSAPPYGEAAAIPPEVRMAHTAIKAKEWSPYNTADQCKFVMMMMITATSVCMCRATSKGNEAKSKMKHPSDMPKPRFELGGGSDM